MRKTMFTTIGTFFCGVLSTTIFATSLNIYEKPEGNSKIITSVQSGDQLMPIFYPDKKEWVKVANPKNGDVGWVKADALKGPMIVVPESSNSNKGKK